MTSFIFRNVRLSFCDAPYLKKDLKDRRFEDGDLGNQKLIPILVTSLNAKRDMSEQFPEM